MNLSYMIARIFSKFSKNKHEYMSNYFRKKGIVVGTSCNILSNIATSEPYLISIGNNTTVSSEVLFLTHDASVGKIFGKENFSDVLGRIIIGNNCFIGARSTILYGITLADNIIVAAGSVVTKSFEEKNIIIGGNPAKKIGTWDNLKEKTKDKAYSLHNIKGDKAKNLVLSSQDKLIKK